MFGKKITMFLVNGRPDGLIKCELSNWNGQCLKVPRNMLSKSKDRDEISTTGIYILIGADESGDSMVYVGEGENVYNRLSKHDIAKEFWNEAIIFSSKDRNLTKAHVQYLEEKLIKLINEGSTYSIDNNNLGNSISLPESDEAMMGEYLENLKIITPTLGYNFFQNKEETIKDVSGELRLSSKAYDAKAYLTNGGLLVKQGSEMSRDIKEYLSDGYKRIRENIIKNNIVELAEDKFVFINDFEFKSPSAAAAIIVGRPSNGRIMWKNKKGLSIKEMEEKSYDE
ncbi:MAG: GIY-YIG nuclease family protein [Clostridia bacterium]|jgi:hypothetical protein|nr:GIY-YIG nuclease family protein [Clostridia bacterium]